MHCGAEVTESSTNKQHHLSPRRIARTSLLNGSSTTSCHVFPAASRRRSVKVVIKLASLNQPRSPVLVHTGRRRGTFFVFKVRVLNKKRPQRFQKKLYQSGRGARGRFQGWKGREKVPRVEGGRGARGLSTAAIWRTRDEFRTVWNSAR